MASVNVIDGCSTLAFDSSDFEHAWGLSAAEPDNSFVLFEQESFPFIARVPLGLDPVALRQAIDSTLQEYMTPPFTRLKRDLQEWIRIKCPKEAVVLRLAGDLNSLYQLTTTNLEAAADFAKALGEPLLLSDSAVQYLPLSSSTFPCSPQNFSTYRRMVGAFGQNTLDGLRRDYGSITLRDADAERPIELVDDRPHTLLTFSFLRSAAARQDKEPLVSGEAPVTLKLLEFPNVTAIPAYVRGLLVFVRTFFPEHLQAFNEDMVKIAVTLGVPREKLQFLDLPVDFSGPLKDPLKLFPSTQVEEVAKFCSNHKQRWSFAFEQSTRASRHFADEVKKLTTEGEAHWNARKEAAEGSFERVERDRKHAEIVSQMDDLAGTHQERHRDAVLSFDGPFPFVLNSFHAFFLRETRKVERKTFLRAVFRHELEKDPEGQLFLLVLVNSYYKFDLKEMVLELMHEDEAIRALFMQGAKQRMRMVGAFCLDVFSAYCKKDGSGKAMDQALSHFFATEEDFDQDQAAERLFILLSAFPEALVEKTLRFLFSRWVGMRGLELSPEGATVHLEEAGIFRKGFDPLYLKEMVVRVLDDAKGKKVVDSALDTARLPSDFNPTMALSDLEEDASVALMETVEIDMEDVLPRPTRFYIRPVKNRRDGEKRAWSLVLRSYAVNESGVRQSAVSGTIRDGVYSGDETRPDKREMLRRLGILAAHRYYVREKEDRTRSSGSGIPPVDRANNPSPKEFRLVEGREGAASITLDISTHDEIADRQTDAVLRMRVGENLSRIRRILAEQAREGDLDQVEVYESTPSPVQGKVLYRKVASDLVQLAAEMGELKTQEWFAPVTTPHTRLAGCYDAKTEGGIILVESKQPAAHSLAGYEAYRKTGGEELNLNPYRVQMNLRADARVDEPGLIELHLADEETGREPVITLLTGRTSAPLDGNQETLTARICQQLNAEGRRASVDDLLRRVSALEAVIDESHRKVHDAALEEMGGLYAEIGRLLFEPAQEFPVGPRFRVELPLQVELDNPRVFNQGTFVPLSKLS